MSEFSDKWYVSKNARVLRILHYQNDNIMNDIDICVRVFEDWFKNGKYACCMRFLKWCTWAYIHYDLFVCMVIERISSIKDILTHQFISEYEMNSYTGQPGFTILEYTIICNMRDSDMRRIISHLINLDADVNMYTIVTYLSRFPNILYTSGCIFELLLNKFDVNERDDNGNTILHIIPMGRKSYLDGRLETYILQGIHVINIDELNNVTYTSMVMNICQNYISNKNKLGYTPFYYMISFQSDLVIYYLSHNIGLDQIDNIQIIKNVNIYKRILESLKITMNDGQIINLWWMKVNESDIKKINEMKTLHSIIWNSLPIPVAEEIMHYVYI